MTAKRGRKSAAELSIVQTNVVEAVPRPTAPDDLTDEQASEWEAVVSRMPADWFPRETHGMLTLYCRHIVSARRVAQLIENAEGYDIDEFNKLLIMQEREGRAISSLATRMRISQQSAYDKTKPRAKETSGKKPWER